MKTDEKIALYDKNVDLGHIFEIIWKKKIFILSTTFFFGIASVFYTLNLEDIYKSEAILAPESTDGQETLNNFSSFAMMAGISVPGEKNNKQTEAIERMKSLEFYTNYIHNSIKIQDLCAQKSWNKSTNQVTYDQKKFDPVNNLWRKNKCSSDNKEPSAQKAHVEFMRIFSIIKDKDTSFIKLSIEHISPYIAKEWLYMIINKLNESMRDADRKKASKSIEFLSNKMMDENNAELRAGLAQLLQVQTETLMLIEANDDYIFKTLDSPVVSEEKFKPSRSIICILVTLLTFVSSIMYTLLSFAFKPKNL